MKLRIGAEGYYDIECDSVHIEFIDQTVIVQTEDFIIVNPSTIKAISVKGMK